MKLFEPVTWKLTTTDWWILGGILLVSFGLGIGILNYRECRGRDFSRLYCSQSVLR